MAITDVDHVWSEEVWSDERRGAREYEDMYRVTSDDPLESAVTVRADSRLPQIGDFYLDDPAARCKRRVARRSEKSRLLWEVTVVHNYDPDDTEDENPLAEPVKIRWNSASVLKPVVKDINGEAIVNSAGDYYDPPPEIDDPRWVATIQFNVVAVPVGIAAYRGAVNSAAISIGGYPVASERARMVGLDISELQTQNDVDFYTVTLGIEVQDAGDEGFDLSLLDQGFRIKDGTDLKDILIEDEDGTEARPTSPVLLNGAGDKLADPSPGNAIFREHEVTRKMPFSVFPGIV